LEDGYFTLLFPLLEDGEFKSWRVYFFRRWQYKFPFSGDVEGELIFLEEVQLTFLEDGTADVNKGTFMVPSMIYRMESDHPLLRASGTT
jgi:hypothetical protein